MKEFTVASTTDSLEDVNIAAGIEPQAKEDVEEVEPPSEVPESQPEIQEPEPVSEPDTEEAEAPKPKQHGKRWFDKRIDQLVRERAEAEADRDALREQLAKIGTVPPAQPAAPATPNGKPVRTSFKSDEEWVEAISEWKADQVIAARERQAAEAAIRERDAQVYSSYVQMADDYSGSHPDFNQVIQAIRVSEDIAPGVQAAIMGRPNGPEVAYYLGQHPEVCENLSQMNPADAVAEIGAISLSLVPRASQTRVPRTPATINPVTGGSTRVARDPGEMEYDEYRKYRGDGPPGSGLYHRRRR